MKKKILRIETYRFDDEGNCHSYLLANQEIVGIAYSEKHYDREYGNSWEVDLLVVEEVVSHRGKEE